MSKDSLDWRAAGAVEVVPEPGTTVRLQSCSVIHGDWEFDRDGARLNGEGRPVTIETCGFRLFFSGELTFYPGWTGIKA